MNEAKPDPGMESATVAVVIPCYRVRTKIVDVIRSLPSWVSAIYVVDDKCPEDSGKFVRSASTDPRVTVLFHEFNRGVGGAMRTGYQAALDAGHTVIVKVDGDGQMDTDYLARLVNPVLDGTADFTKGNRFYDMKALQQMPLLRRVGNFGLTLLTKVASGHWHVSDPTNGYTAVHRAALRLLTLDRLSRRYFFETSMLIQLNIIRAVALDVPIPARYADEESSLSITRTLFGFPPRLVAGLMQRLLWRYFIYDINAVTILLLCGTIMTGGGLVFGGYRWVVGQVEQSYQSTGTVALALLPVILGFQMLLQAVLLDVVDKPNVTLSRLLQDRWKNPQRT